MACPAGRRSPERLNPDACNSGQRQPKQCRELLDAVPQPQNLLPQFWFREVCQIKTDDDRRRGAEPPPRRRARDTQVRGDSQVSGASDEIPEPMVVALLRARGGPHLDDRRPFARPDQILEDLAGVRRRQPGRPQRRQLALKAQNVRADSSAPGWSYVTGRRL